MNSKRWLIISLIIFVIVLIFIILWNNELSSQNSSLRSIKYELEDEIYELENKVEEAEDALNTCITDKEDLYNSYEDLYNSYEDLLDQFDYYTDREEETYYYQDPSNQRYSSNSYNQYKSKTPAINQSTNSKLTKTFHNNGSVIALEFENLHKLLSYSNIDFDKTMKSHGYKMESNSDAYVHQQADCCISIRRSNGELQLIYTGNVDSDIVQVMVKNGISSEPYKNFRRYSYRRDGRQYFLNYKSSYDATHIVLQY